MIPDTATKEKWSERYESLRAATFGHRSESWGMALVVRHGLAAWIYAWPSEAGGMDEVSDPVRAVPSGGPISRPPNGLVALLTSMVLATRLGGAA